MTTPATAYRCDDVTVRDDLGTRRGYVTGQTVSKAIDPLVPVFRMLPLCAVNRSTNEP